MCVYCVSVCYLCGWFRSVGEERGLEKQELGVWVVVLSGIFWVFYQRVHSKDMKRIIAELKGKLGNCESRLELMGNEKSDNAPKLVRFAADLCELQQQLEDPWECEGKSGGTAAGC